MAKPPAGSSLLFGAAALLLSAVPAFSTPRTIEYQGREYPVADQVEIGGVWISILVNKETDEDHLVFEGFTGQTEYVVVTCGPDQHTTYFTSTQSPIGYTASLINSYCGNSYKP